MALSAQQSLSQYGTTAYTGWGEAEAAADFRAKGGSSGSSSGNPLVNLFNSGQSEIDKYVQELKQFAQDDYNFAAKFIEEQYTKALGTNDAERQAFLKEVANTLEQEVGRIAFDYNTNTYRLERDKTKALDRLAQDEAVAKEEMGIQTQLEREQQNSSLNARGIASGPRDKQVGLAGREVSTLEDDIKRRQNALERSVLRSRDDINTSAEDSLTDLTTGARRSAIDTQANRDYQLEQAKREKERREREAIISGRNETNRLKSLTEAFS